MTTTTTTTTPLYFYVLTLVCTFIWINKFVFDDNNHCVLFICPP